MILRAHHATDPRRRRGVILIVVLAILTLLAILGLTFVTYSQAEATSSRIWKEAGTKNNERDLLRAAAENAWNMTLGQQVYGVRETDQDFVLSALWGHDLARTMYGWNPNGFLPPGQQPTGLNDKPYVGTGRLRETLPPVAPFPFLSDTEFLVNHTYHAADGFIRYPGRLGARQPGANPLFPPNLDTTNPLTGDLHMSYTFPDHNNMFLAQVDIHPGPGLDQGKLRVNVPSYHRDWVVGPGFSLGNPAAPAWIDPQARYRIMRPRPLEHPQFPAIPAGETGDVKNLDFAAGGNDSIWIDIGAPVMVGPDGVTRFKAMVAPLLIDLDGRINLNTAGNLQLNRNVVAPVDNRGHASNQGWGPWEVNPSRVLDFVAPPNPPLEWKNAFLGDPSQGLRGRYGLSGQPQGPGGIQGGGLLRRYSPMDYNAITETAANVEYGPPINPALQPAVIPPYQLTPQWRFPGDAATPTTPVVPIFQAFPFYSRWGYNNARPLETNYPPGPNPPYSHPDQFNAIAPAPGNRAFGANDLVALLRRANVGGDLVASDLMRLLPNNLEGPANAFRRNRVTTHSFDMDRPGNPPYIYAPTGYTYTVPMGATYSRPAAGGQSFPTVTLAQRQAPVPATSYSEFSPANWASDLSQRFYTAPPALPWRPAAAAHRSSGGARIDLGRKLTSFPNPTAGWEFDLGTPAIQAQVAQATKDRTDLAWDIYTTLWQLVGAPPYAGLDPQQPTLPAFRTHRWLAQLAANIVDYIDYDDYMTVFQWLPGHVVIGTEMPRLVINEYYAQWDNNVLVANAESTPDYKVNVWAELHNPFMPEKDASILNPSNDPAGGRAILQRTMGGEAIYRMVLTGTPNANIRVPENVLGAHDGGMAQIANRLIDWGANREVRPGFGLYDEGTTPTLNNGFYVVAPTDYAANLATADPFGIALTPTLKSAQMSYTQPLANDPTIPPGAGGTDYRPALLLQRLANPYMRLQETDATRSDYNPYVTVDYVEQLRVNDYRLRDNAGADLMPALKYPNVGSRRAAYGKDQPFAAGLDPADVTPDPILANWRKQNNTDADQADFAKVRHTFFRHNAIEPASPPAITQPNPGAAGQTLRVFEPLQHLDRQPASLGDLLHVSGFRPHELTQQFVTYIPTMTTPTRAPYSHIAPWDSSVTPAGQRLMWTDPTVRVHRLLEHLTLNPRAAGIAANGRIPGKININTVWDKAVFDAIVDAYAPTATRANRFHQADVDAIWTTLVASRRGGPANPEVGPASKPFWGLGTGLTPGAATDALSPNVAQVPRGIANTMLRPSPLRPDQFLLETPAPVGPPPPALAQALLRTEVLSKIMGNLTTRSNVFGMWTTIGFFKVVDESQKPVRLGAEVIWPTNGRVRFRTFALIDRTQLQVWPTYNDAGAATVRYGGPAILPPVKAPALQPNSQVVPLGAFNPQNGQFASELFDANSQRMVQLSNPNTGYLWSLFTVNAAPAPANARQGIVLTFDPDTANEETVVVRFNPGNPAANPPDPARFEATFTKPHATGCIVISRGNPGPWTAYDPTKDVGVIMHQELLD